MTGSVEPIERVEHVKTAIAKLRSILIGVSFEDAIASDLVWPALERYLETISEASRHIPADWKDQFGPDIPWRRIADLGNSLRHAYTSVQANVLWTIVHNDLGPLEAALDAMLDAHARR